MASKRIGIVISEDLYKKLKSFSDSESETITQTITIAIKERINKQPIQGIPLIPNIPLIPKVPTTTKEKTIGELLYENNEEKCFIDEQKKQILDYINKLSEDEQSLLYDKLKDYVYDNRSKDNIKINDFFDWIKPKLSPQGENILDLCDIIFKEEEFFAIKEYLRTLTNEECNEINKKCSRYLTDKGEIIPNFLNWIGV